MVHCGRNTQDFEYTTLEHFSCIVPVRFEFYWLGKLGLLHWGHRKEHFE
jgi:hypothetical protein